MAILRCKMCGANLNVSESDSIVTCEYCGSTQTISLIDDEKKINLFNRANALRINGDFDKAYNAYEKIIEDFPKDAEAYWGLCLSKYGIEYVENKLGERYPTCHRTITKSIFNDYDYRQTLKYSDLLTQETYRKEAERIDSIQKQIISIYQTEKSYDVFLSYDSQTSSKIINIIDELYAKLKSLGYHVFSVIKDLENKEKTAREPYIYAALKSAKIMFVFGSNNDEFNNVWVKNEWGRFISFMKDNKKKYLIPCYLKTESYDLPKEFVRFPMIDLSFPTYIDDLLKCVEKIIPIVKDEHNEIMDEEVENEISDNTKETLVKMVSNVNYSDANPSLYDKYLNGFLKDYNVSSLDDFYELSNDVSKNLNFIKAYKYASLEEKDKLLSIKEAIHENILQEKYQHASELMDNGSYGAAISIFNGIKGYLDSEQKSKECNSLIKENYENDKTADVRCKLDNALKNFDPSYHRSTELLIQDCLNKLLRLCDTEEEKLIYNNYLASYEQWKINTKQEVIISKTFKEAHHNLYVILFLCGYLICLVIFAFIIILLSI